VRAPSKVGGEVTPTVKAVDESSTLLKTST
jgi:hypothetical protein